MFYAASEILFWILLAAVIGGGIGYGLSQAKMVRLNQRLTQSRADAPMERELAIAWDTIEDLKARLQIAHETIRGGIDTEPEADVADDPDPPSATGEIVEEELDRIVAEKMAEAAKAKNKNKVDNGTVGARLSERVASASPSTGIDFSDGLDS